MAILLGLAVVAASGGYAWLRRRPTVTDPPVASEPAPAPAQVPPPIIPPPRLAPVHFATPTEPDGGMDRGARVATAPASPPAPPPPPAEAPPAEARPPAERRVDPDELLSVIRRIPITAYVTSWCPACAAAGQWCRDNQLACTEHDIEKDPTARQRQRALNPRGGVPTIEIEGQVLVGFSRTSMMKALTAAARRRLEGS